MTDADWLAKRRTLLTATDAPAILGVHPFKSALQVYLEKTGGMELSKMNEAMRAGQLLEPVVAQLYAEETGRKVELPPERLSTHPTHSWMGASLDRIAIDDEVGRMVLELKTTSTDIRNELPMYWQVQVAHQMEVIGLDRASVGVLMFGRRFIWRDIDRNERFTEALVRKLRHFWHEHVLKRIPPLPDGSESAARGLAAMYDKPVDETVELPDDAVAWAEQYHAAGAEMKRQDELKQAAQNAICAAMGNATVGVTPDGRRFTWRKESRKGFAVEAKEIRVFRASRARR